MGEARSRTLFRAMGVLCPPVQPNTEKVSRTPPVEGSRPAKKSPGGTRLPSARPEQQEQSSWDNGQCKHSHRHLHLKH